MCKALGDFSQPNLPCRSLLRRSVPFPIVGRTRTANNLGEINYIDLRNPYESVSSDFSVTRTLTESYLQFVVYL